MKRSLLVRVEFDDRDVPDFAGIARVDLHWSRGLGCGAEWFTTHDVPESAQVAADDLVERIAKKVHQLFSEEPLFPRRVLGVSDGGERPAGLPNAQSAQRNGVSAGLRLSRRAADSRHAEKIPDR